jgi:hypothetical protein
MAILILLAAIGTVMTAASALTTVALADKSSGSNGLETADKKIHENTHSSPGDLSQQDVNFHVGTCQGGHSTKALNDLFKNGCNDLPSPSELGSGHNGK